MGITGSRTGTLGGKDSFGSAEGNMRVKDGSGFAWDVAEGGKAAENDKGSENFRGR